MSREVVCRNELNEKNLHMCNYLEKPVDAIDCNTQACPTWNYGDWTKCDHNCKKHRKVRCQNASGRYIFCFLRIVL